MNILISDRAALNCRSVLYATRSFWRPADGNDLRAEYIKVLLGRSRRYGYGKFDETGDPGYEDVAVDVFSFWFNRTEGERKYGRLGQQPAVEVFVAPSGDVVASDVFGGGVGGVNTALKIGLRDHGNQARCPDRGPMVLESV